MSHYVLLDRDGVINQDSDAYIKSAEEWIPISGSPEAIALLNDFGYKVVVLTNQSGLARGLFNKMSLQQIHEKMRKIVSAAGGNIEAIYMCPHGPKDGCHCRKPEPGMLKQFASDYGVDLNGVSFIGDSLKDIQAAQAAGARPILVKTGKGERTLSEITGLELLVFENLYDAARFIIKEKPL